jgi:hypothetical protein
LAEKIIERNNFFLQNTNLSIDKKKYLKRKLCNKEIVKSNEEPFDKQKVYKTKKP